MSTLTASGAGVSPLRALSFTLFASLITIPAIAVAIYARNHVLDAGKAVYGLDPRRLGRVEKIVRVICSCPAASFTWAPQPSRVCSSQRVIGGAVLTAWRYWRHAETQDQDSA
jgi:hypothetical protein